MADAATLQTAITTLEARIRAFAGVKTDTVGDRSITFDLEGAQAELARLRTELAQLTAASGSTTRYAAFDAGLTQ